jgi:hypothetical protein
LGLFDRTEKKRTETWGFLTGPIKTEPIKSQTAWPYSLLDLIRPYRNKSCFAGPYGPQF